ncbi:MAG: zinc-ribbon domain-containing protein [Chloroflexi bacterium]|nr:zinc-ribbon domain-containing protein [Chloroflexota bacterium]
MWFIVFFGTREVVRDADRLGAGGYQTCPRCGQDVLFRPRSARTWLHVFWIPVIPLGQVTPILECGNCRLRLASLG